MILEACFVGTFFFEASSVILRAMKCPSSGVCNAARPASHHTGYKGSFNLQLAGFAWKQASSVHRSGSIRVNQDTNKYAQRMLQIGIVSSMVFEISYLNPA